MTMRLVPEYKAVQKLYLSFVQKFFNTRFGYGKTICDMAEAAVAHVDVEILVSQADLPHLQDEFRQRQLDADKLTLNFDSPGRGILAEYTPIFAENDDGKLVALVFDTPSLDRFPGLKQFSQRWAQGLGALVVDVGFDFGTAYLSVNEDLVLLSARGFEGERGASKLSYFRQNFPDQSFFVVPPLAGERTADMDMVVWPIAPRAWIVSEYPAHSPQEASIAPTLRVLEEQGHAVHRVPGLEHIQYDDIDTMPNYANGVLLNRLALAPAYQREEDDVVQGILRDYGYDVVAIDCRNVILTNSALHCISKTVPKSGST